MRHDGRFVPVVKGSLALFMLCAITACSFPHFKLDKKQHVHTAGRVGYAASTLPGEKAKDKKYLATLHVRFGEGVDAPALHLDIRRDKKSFIAAKLLETEETVTTFHLGYTRGDGPIVGTRFLWRF